MGWADKNARLESSEVGKVCCADCVWKGSPRCTHRGRFQLQPRNEGRNESLPCTQGEGPGVRVSIPTDTDHKFRLGRATNLNITHGGQTPHFSARARRRGIVSHLARLMPASSRWPLTLHRRGKPGGSRRSTGARAKESCSGARSRLNLNLPRLRLSPLKAWGFLSRRRRRNRISRLRYLQLKNFYQLTPGPWADKNFGDRSLRTTLTRCAP